MANSVLVTGTSTGFGQEIALTLAERGFTVYATMRNLARRDALDASAQQRNIKLRVLQLDVTDSSSIERAVETVVEESGGIFGVVNNAGIMLRGYFEDLSDAEIRELFDTNFYGTLAVTRAVLPHMRKAGTGRIVIITSVAGKIGSPSGSAYSASRFAQEGFGESLRQEVEPLGITVSLIEPGITKTDSWTVDKGAGKNTSDPDSPYYAWFKNAEALFDRQMNDSSNTVQDVAAAVYKALSDPQPRWRYMVGRWARLVVNLRRIIPEELFAQVYFGEVMRRVTGADNE
ncbi:MAG: SDR family oxidoreductase [Chloroflexota bacterium]|nr:SDR family oxidoreductase [Chloroflexota bacterium]